MYKIIKLLMNYTSVYLSDVMKKDITEIETVEMVLRDMIVWMNHNLIGDTSREMSIVYIHRKLNILQTDMIDGEIPLCLKAIVTIKNWFIDSNNKDLIDVDNDDAVDILYRELIKYSSIDRTTVLNMFLNRIGLTVVRPDENDPSCRLTYRDTNGNIRIVDDRIRSMISTLYNYSDAPMLLTPEHRALTIYVNRESSFNFKPMRSIMLSESTIVLLNMLTQYFDLLMIVDENRCIWSNYLFYTYNFTVYCAYINRYGTWREKVKKIYDVQLEPLDLKTVHNILMIQATTTQDNDLKPIIDRLLHLIRTHYPDIQAPTNKTGIVDYSKIDRFNRD